MIKIGREKVHRMGRRERRLANIATTEWNQCFLVFCPIKQQCPDRTSGQGSSAAGRRIGAGCGKEKNNHQNT